jgi:hypothetical protein
MLLTATRRKWQLENQITFVYRYMKILYTGNKSESINDGQVNGAIGCVNHMNKLNFICSERK